MRLRDSRNIWGYISLLILTLSLTWKRIFDRRHGILINSLIFPRYFIKTVEITWVVLDLKVCSIILTIWSGFWYTYVFWGVNKESEHHFGAKVCVLEVFAKITALFHIHINLNNLYMFHMNPKQTALVLFCTNVIICKREYINISIIYQYFYNILCSCRYYFTPNNRMFLYI